jgi:predicted DNA-binding protein
MSCHIAKMTKAINFRSPKLLDQNIKKLSTKLGYTKTETIVMLLERGLESVNAGDVDLVVQLNNQIKLMTRLTVQSLCVINQIGDMAGSDVLNNAEQEYIELLDKLGIKT